MAPPLFVLKSKTKYSDTTQGIRIELEPLVDADSADFWADPDNPSGRCEFYIAASKDADYPLGGKFRISLTLQSS